MKTEQAALVGVAGVLGYLYWKKTQEGGNPPPLDPVHPPVIPNPNLPPPVTPVIPDPSFPPGSPENPLQPDQPLGPIIPIVDRYEQKQIATLIGWSKEELASRYTEYYAAHYVNHTKKQGDLTWQELYAFDMYQDVATAKQVASYAALLRTLGWKNQYRQITSGGASAAWGEWWTAPGWPDAWQSPNIACGQVVAEGNYYTADLYTWIVTNMGVEYVAVWNTAWAEVCAYSWNGTAWVKSGTVPPPGGGGSLLPVTVSGLRASPTSAYVGDFVTISFEVTNPNSASQTFNLNFSGAITTATLSGTLLPYETRTVTLGVAVTWTGTRTSTLVGASISVTGVAVNQPPPPCNQTPQPSPWHDTVNRLYVPYKWDQGLCAWTLDQAGAYSDGTTPPPNEPPFSYADLPTPYSECSQRQHDAAVYFGRSYSYYAGGSSCQYGIPPVGAYVVVSCSGGL